MEQTSYKDKVNNKLIGKLTGYTNKILLLILLNSGFDSFAQYSQLKSLSINSKEYDSLIYPLYSSSYLSPEEFKMELNIITKDINNKNYKKLGYKKILANIDRLSIEGLDLLGAIDDIIVNDIDLVLDYYTDILNKFPLANLPSKNEILSLYLNQQKYNIELAKIISELETNLLVYDKNSIQFNQDVEKEYLIGDNVFSSKIVFSTIQQKESYNRDLEGLDYTIIEMKIVGQNDVANFTPVYLIHFSGLGVGKIIGKDLKQVLSMSFLGYKSNRQLSKLPAVEHINHIINDFNGTTNNNFCYNYIVSGYSLGSTAALDFAKKIYEKNQDNIHVYIIEPYKISDLVKNIDKEILSSTVIINIEGSLTDNSSLLGCHNYLIPLLDVDVLNIENNNIIHRKKKIRGKFSRHSPNNFYLWDIENIKYIPPYND